MKYWIISLLLAIIIVSPAHSGEWDSSFDISLEGGLTYYKVKFKDRSEADLYDGQTRLKGNWALGNGFFMGTQYSQSFPGSREDEIYNDNLISPKNQVKLDENTFDIYGGYKLNPLFQPYLGLSISHLKLDRSRQKRDNADLSVMDQTYSEIDLLLGVKGLFEFNDYTSLGYSFSYASTNSSEGETEDHSSDDIESSKILSELFLEYWLPNELWRIGFHLYGGQYLYEKKEVADELLPETDIKFIGAVLSLKVRL